jgi:hypothetical protein
MSSKASGASVRASSAITLLALVGAIWTFAKGSFAFCRATTCPKCVPPAGECVAEGMPLYWPNGCVSYSVQQDATKWATLEAATIAVDAAFEAWSGLACPDTGTLPSIRFVNTGPVACGAHQYNSGETTIGGNANIIAFNDKSWVVDDTSADPEATLALTFVTYDVRSGEILDADILVNGQNVLSTSAQVPATAYDLQSLMTHEVGHFIGLAHTPSACSTSRNCPTMRSVYRKGDDTFRTLESDDIAGVCAIYPQGRGTDPSCVPNFGFTGECGLEVKAKSASCQVAEGRTPLGQVAAAIAGSVAFSWFTRMRSKRRKPSRAAPSCPTSV